jgi:hypothetical protein
MHRLIRILLCLSLAGCATTALVPDVTLKGSAIQVEARPPGSGYSEISTLRAVNGTEQCDVPPEVGTREGAMATLRNQAAQLGADYVMIFEEQGPHLEVICQVHAYIIKATAYKKTNR